MAENGGITRWHVFTFRYNLHNDLYKHREEVPEPRTCIIQ